MADVPACSSDTTNQPFDAEEVSLRLLLCERDQHRAVAAAEIDLERSTPAEDELEIERRNEARHQFSGGKGSRIRAHERIVALRERRATKAHNRTNHVQEPH